MPAAEFVEYKTITDSEGVLQAVITFRTRSSGERLFSFSFMRSFDQGGTLKRTCWANIRHAPAMVRLIPIVVAEIEKAEEEYKKEKYGE